MAMTMTTPPRCSLIDALHLIVCSSSAAAKELIYGESRTVCFNFTPSHHCLCSYSAGNPCPSSVSHEVKRMNFRYMSSEVSNLYLQTRSTKNTQFEHQVSSLNLASRALSIVVQDMDVEVSFWVEESINFKLVSFQYSTNQSLEDWLLIFKVLGVTCFVDVQLLPFSSAHWLLCLGNKPLLVTGASLPNDHYNFLTVDILLPWSITQRRRLYTTPT
ncbi:BnaC04g43200D [Brassica napus]|uniref:Uncharacterized protein n=2 Tax=Brassica TaxID=3705 RepID=A0A3P6CW66_BRAOL|nr:unnamed protein product [Brassica napus]CDY48529.1 BnaC04g43200D [Brassica napus]VDD14531.1 unnamed protein product [Brassica oleracea]